MVGTYINNIDTAALASKIRKVKKMTLKDAYHFVDVQELVYSLIAKDNINKSLVLQGMMSECIKQKDAIAFLAVNEIFINQ